MKTKYAAMYGEFEDTKGVIRMLHSIPKVQYNERRHHILHLYGGPKKSFEDSKGVIRIRKSRKDRQDNGHKR